MDPVDTGGLAGAEEQLKSLTRLSEQLSKALSSAFAEGVVHGKRFEDVLKGVGLKLADLALKAALKPIEGVLSSGLDALVSGAGGAVLPFARGGVVAGGRVQPFAEGGVVAAPTYFPLRGGLGLAGERGPEAILPLARGPDGRLGVQGPAARPLQVVVNVTTPDVESFRRSEAQVAAALARAVARGSRAM